MAISDDTYYKILRDEWLLCSRRAIDLQSWTLTVFVAVFGYGLTRIDWFQPKPAQYVAAAVLLVLAQFFNLVIQGFAVLIVADMNRLAGFLAGMEDRRGDGRGWEQFASHKVHPQLGRGLLFRLPNSIHVAVAYLSVGGVVALRLCAPPEVVVHMWVALALVVIMGAWGWLIGREFRDWRNDYAYWRDEARMWYGDNQSHSGTS